MDLPAHQSYLKDFTVGDLLQIPQQLVFCNENDSVESVLNQLRKYRILSLPVYSDDKNDFTGLVNLLDISTALVFQKLFELYDDQKLDELSDELWEKASNMEVMESPIGSLVGISEESKTLWMFDATSDLRDLLNVFSKGVHRVLVKFHNKNALAPLQIGNGNTYARLLSQTDVLRFLKANAAVPALKEQFSKAITQCNLVNNDKNSIVTMPSTSSALTGFQKITLHDVSALPIVDEHGKLLATLSTSDLRGTHRDTFRNVLLPVLDFLKSTRGIAHDNITAKAGDTLDNVANSMLQGKVHRVWIINDQEQPIGVVTITDIINQFSPYQ